MTNPKPTSQFLAYIAVLVGVVLLLSGAAASLGYLGLPILGLSNSILSAQLGQVAVICLGLVGGTLAFYHGLSSIGKRRSSKLKLPPIYFFWIVFALALGLGNLVSNFSLSQAYLFPPLFALGAALPVLGVVAWVARRLGWPITWRQGALAFVTGGTLGILVAIVAEVSISFFIYWLTAPMWALGGFDSGPDLFSRLVFSPAVVFFLFITALQAPIPEEFAKALSLPLFGRQRITTERQALLIGLCSGAGFAILENMLYEGLYAQQNGWTWGGVTLLRGVGAVLHPLCAGIVAVGWFRMREQGAGQLLKAYALAVGLHTLWNGGFQALLYVTGLDFYGGLGGSFDLYGTAIESLLAVYLVGLSLGLWWLLRRRVNGLMDGVVPGVETATPALATPRALAGWAFVCALVIVPIGAALGQSWPQIATVMFPGR